MYDLVGPSGSGKSTLLRVCARTLARDGGELFLDGAPSSSFEPVQWRRRVCLVPQQPALVGGTVRDNLLLPWTLSVNAGSAPPADGDLERLLEAADLHDVELGRNAAQLSGGQAARVALLRAFATRPRVLLLDEVDAALDDESARAVAAPDQIARRRSHGLSAHPTPRCRRRGLRHLLAARRGAVVRVARRRRRGRDALVSGGVVDIGYVELFSASALMLVAGLVSWKLELGQTRRIVVSSVRCFMQLLAAGFLLTYLFEFQTWWLVALVLAAMVIAATQIAVSRVKSRIPGLVPSVFVSLFVSSLVVGFIVVEGVVRADPWFHARQVVPIVGMIMGNAMAAVAVAIDRLFSDLDARASEMFSLTALGATPREAAAPSLKAAIGAGMTPVLANMSAAGIVTFPGMMTGQLLAGADPLSAAKYQIVVMLMLSAANTVAIVTACFMTYRKRFAPDGYYLDEGIR